MKYDEAKVQAFVDAFDAWVLAYSGRAAAFEKVKDTRIRLDETPAPSALSDDDRAVLEQCATSGTWATALRVLCRLALERNGR